MSPTVVEPPVISTKPGYSSGSKSSEPKSPVPSPLRFKHPASPEEEEPPESAVRSTIPKDEEPAKKPESPPKRPESPPKKSECPPKRDTTPVPSQDSTPKLPLIDMETFQQILELDEEPEYEFTQQMVEAYFEQAADTFEKMDVAFKKKDLADLASLGHFLKGSSAALGLSRVQATCEIMQHSGQLRDEEKNIDLTTGEALSIIEGLLKRVKVEYEEAETWLKTWCEEHAA